MTEKPRRRRVYVDELIGPAQVAEILGLSNPHHTHEYAKRDIGMPLPVVDLGPGQPKLWLRPEIERWQASRKKR